MNNFNQYKDVIGKKFGNLLVLEEVRVSYAGSNKNKKTQLKLICQCDCGHKITAYKTNVLNGKSKSCGHCANSENFSGKKIGTIKLLNRISDPNYVGWSYEILCDCGIKFKRPWILIRNRTWSKCIHRTLKKDLPKMSWEENMDRLRHASQKKHIENRKNLINTKIGYLKVKKFAYWKECSGIRRPFYKCKCKCGKEIYIKGDQLRITKSCGCLQKESLPKGENQARSKLKNAEAKVIRELYFSKMGYRLIDLANMFNVTESCISGVIRNKTYKSV